MKLMSVYFPNSKYADYHIGKYLQDNWETQVEQFFKKKIKKHMLNRKKIQSLEEISMLRLDEVKKRRCKSVASTL